MVKIPSGDFLMGASDDSLALPREFPQHRVAVDGFWMDPYEVTNARFMEFILE